MAADKNEQSDNNNLERRQGKDRRNGKLDKKYRYSVDAGFFLDMRRGDRRKSISEESLISLN